jgi:hypothetical protein
MTRAAARRRARDAFAARNEAADSGGLADQPEAAAFSVCRAAALAAKAADVGLPIVLD